MGKESQSPMDNKCQKCGDQPVKLFALVEGNFCEKCWEKIQQKKEKK